ncbi:hypothetical protein AXG93_723s1130 [Marchantia polymorpha subsp. ruderalis]|uniref:Uncharacterized protein n=1 Tax=Marchantia polymorpha subsp. ruderalis TaxID=1480154 RepID=A0A176VD73_MARPO|nr:hypothetical protein AXG93_723s1130 [Marchantia polymorpha subsp. ruderalis]
MRVRVHSNRTRRDGAYGECPAAPDTNRGSNYVVRLWEVMGGMTSGRAVLAMSPVPRAAEKAVDVVAVGAGGWQRMQSSTRGGRANEERPAHHERRWVGHLRHKRNEQVDGGWSCPGREGSSPGSDADMVRTVAMGLDIIPRCWEEEEGVDK